MRILFRLKSNIAWTDTGWVFAGGGGGGGGGVRGGRIRSSANDPVVT